MEPVEPALNALVAAVSRSAVHEFSKDPEQGITLLTGLGVEGDAHAGTTVKHRSRVARDPSKPNLRQVHLIHTELLAELAAAGFDVKPGDLGENISTTGIDLLGLPTGALLTIGADAVVEITGLRNPCWQIDNFQAGLLKQVVYRDEAGETVRTCGVMGVVRSGGTIHPGDRVSVALPDTPYSPLTPV